MIDHEDVVPDIVHEHGPFGLLGRLAGRVVPAQGEVGFGDVEVADLVELGYDDAGHARSEVEPDVAATRDGSALTGRSLPW